MKKKMALILALCLCLLLTSCGSPGTGGTSADGDGLDDNQYVYAQGWMGYTENAVILSSSNNALQLLSYLPLSLTEPETIICTKADCTHDDKTCNAYVESMASIFVWQDHIYYFAHDAAGDLGLYRMELDGTGRTEVRVLEMAQGYSSFGWDFQVRNGWLILGVTNNEIGNRNTTLYLLPLEDLDADAIVLYTTDNAENENGYRLIISEYCWPFGDWAFFAVPNKDKGVYRLYAHQFSTGETALLSEQWDGVRHIMYKDGTFYWIKDGIELGTLDPETGEQTVITSELGPVASKYQVYDDQYIYVGILAEDEESADAAGMEPGVCVYNYEGDFLQYIPYPEELEDPLFALSTPDYLMFTDWGADSEDEGIFRLPIVGYLEKSAFADGTAEFILLE